MLSAAFDVDAREPYSDKNSVGLWTDFVSLPTTMLYAHRTILETVSSRAEAMRRVAAGLRSGHST